MAKQEALKVALETLSEVAKSEVGTQFDANSYAVEARVDAAKTLLGYAMSNDFPPRLEMRNGEDDTPPQMTPGSLQNQRLTTAINDCLSYLERIDLHELQAAKLFNEAENIVKARVTLDKAKENA